MLDHPIRFFGLGDWLLGKELPFLDWRQSRSATLLERNLQYTGDKTSLPPESPPSIEEFLLLLPKSEMM